MAKLLSIKRIELPVSSGKKLVVESSGDADYKEFYIGLEEDGVWVQDLAVIGEDYFYGDNKLIPVVGMYTVKVYGDSDSEDYTHTFMIDEWKGNELV